MGTNLEGRPENQHEGAPPAARSADCPSLERWGLYEAGLLPDAEALELLEHSSVCDACGALLADMRADVPEQDTQPLLRSGTAAWKKDMLRQIAAQQGDDSRPARSGMRYGWLAAAAAALIAVSAGAAWWIHREDSPDAAFRLLAQSYTERRPFDFRIPGAAPGPIRANRGANPEPTVSLADARSLITRKLRDNPGNADWLRVRARADLLEIRYAEAIDDLRKAQDSDPQNPEILGDLAIAYLERAGSQQRDKDVGDAIGFLKNAIDARPSDPLLRFNRALAFEREGTPDASIDDWKEFLRLEPTGPWAQEAREHLARQELKKKQRARSSGPRSSEDSINLLAARAFQPSPSIDPIFIAADLTIHHGDSWMHDLMTNTDGAANRRALETLATAMREAAAGRASSAEDFDARAVVQFRSYSNYPGALFASFQQAYALQRMSRPECLGVARDSVSQAVSRHYYWLASQLLLTASSCFEMRGNLEAAYDAIIRAQRAAEQGSYETAGLRALGFRAAFLGRLGMYHEAIRLDEIGLQRFWEGQGDPVRAYQFYYDLATNLSAVGDLPAAAAAMREAVEIAARQPDRSVDGMVRASYGDILLRDGRLRDAAAEFDLSARTFAQLPGSPSTRLYQSYAEILRARQAGQENQISEGLHLLDDMEAILPSIRNPALEARFFGAKADILARAGRISESDACLRRVLALRNDSQAPSGADASALSRDVSDAARTLTDHDLIRHDGEGALRLWASWNPSFRTVPAPSAATARLVYADLPSGPVVWIENQSGVYFRRLALSSADLSRLAPKFRRMVSDPHTPDDSIRAIAHYLFQRLIEPVQPLCGAAETIYISASGPFASVPFGALIGNDGVWLADHVMISYSPPMRGAIPSNAPPVGLSSKLIAVSFGDAAESLGETSLPPLPDVEGDSRSAALAFPRHMVLAGAAATLPALLPSLASADVFHFSGHAIVTAADAALVLAPRASGDSDRLLWASRIQRTGAQHCRLVVLAACSTGRAPGEDADPSSVIAGAFLQSGVPEVIASRWDVDSSATSLLVRHLYKDLGSGSTPLAALALAARDLRRNPSFAHPYYWAAFEVFRS